jgi:hypothetical protein
VGKLIDAVIPHVGIKLDFSPLLHFARDLLLAFVLWQIGFRDFQAAFTTLLASGFFETACGISFQADGAHDIFDFLDLLPSAFAGFLVVGLLSGNFDFVLLLNLILIYAAGVVVLLLANIILGRKIIISQ